MQLVLSLPASSVEAERGFSCLNLVKSDCRSRLSEKCLNGEAAIENFDPEPPFDKWFEAAKRRPKGQVQSEPEEDEVESEDEEDLIDFAIDNIAVGALRVAGIWEKLQKYAEMD